MYVQAWSPTSEGPQMGNEFLPSLPKFACGKVTPDFVTAWPLSVNLQDALPYIVSALF